MYFRVRDNFGRSPDTRHGYVIGQCTSQFGQEQTFPRIPGNVSDAAEQDIPSTEISALTLQPKEDIHHNENGLRNSRRLYPSGKTRLLHYNLIPNLPKILIIPK